ncbi:Radical SAM domain protein [Anaeromyxobacter sp. K]|uniref:B12-binding domain-containing radical SAM protein n=1 Tax=Anaeromyxobacter sp. (strain K) TaxID=447217 RepID=UPI00015F889E|nr:radical SAM protein [Anaeromyxobacter sp. K]ACG75196.1 Radical SAM domain protein [Anaeromyxobacter sp. K]
MAGCDVVLVGYEDEENLGLRYLAAYLAQAGVKVALAPYRAGVRRELLAYLRARRPRLVGFSLIFQGMLPDFADLVAYLRANGVTAHFTMGGHFPSLAWERTLALVPGLDTVVRHEGELTLLELVRALDQPARWREIPGLAFRQRGVPVATPARPLVPELDALPFPVRRRETLAARGVGIASLVASRGCYYDCSFCSVQTFYGEPPGPRRRTRSPANVADEMQALHDGKGVRVFIFKDDDLATRGPRARGWIEAFAHELEARRLGRRIAWRISCRVDDLDADLLRRLRGVGLTWVYLGIESGSEQGLRTCNKRFTVGDVRRGVALLRRLRLAFDYGFMLLDPDSTFASVRESVGFLEDLGRRGDASVHFTKMFPYVGTAIAARLAAEGRLAGTDAAPDYAFRDPRLDLLQGFLSEAFHERNFGPAGLVSASRMAAFDLELATRFGGASDGTRAYRAAIRALTADGNAIAISAVRRALDVLEARSLDGCVAAWPALLELARRAREADLELAGRLREVMADNGHDAPRPRALLSAKRPARRRPAARPARPPGGRASARARRGTGAGARRGAGWRG